MKKIVMFVFVLSFLFTGASYAHADTSVDCPANTGHAVYSSDGITINSCISNTDWDSNMAKAAATNVLKLPVITPGTIVTDEAGFSSLYPSWMTTNGYDLTHTDAYRSAMMNIGGQLKALGQSGGIFGYWIQRAQ